MTIFYYFYDMYQILNPFGNLLYKINGGKNA
jgi:hypothetical protein